MVQDLQCRVDDVQLRIQAAPESAGHPVLVHPGTPGSRHLFEPQVEAAAQHGLRLIAWDRPGYGDTPGHPGRTVAAAAAEATVVAAFLGLDRFSTWGFSGGGPYALACAALLPDKVSAAVVIASLAPFDALGVQWSARFSERGREEVAMFFADPVEYRKVHAETCAEYLRARGTAEGWLTAWGERAEADEPHSRALAEHLALNFREALLHGDEGWYEDDAAFLSPWGFDPSVISVPVGLWQGTDDITVDHGRWLAEHIPGARAHIVDGEDHTNIEMRHQEEAWDWLLSLSR